MYKKELKLTSVEYLKFLKWYLDNELDFDESDKLEDYVDKYLKIVKTATK